MESIWRTYIVSTPDVLNGKPRLRETRIPVNPILGYLAEGSSSEQILQEFPDLTATHVTACLDYARELSEVVSAA
jgi:uncharacterized protein (DUF433 family)